MLALAVLAVVLGSAVSRWSEVLVAVPAAALLVGVGAVPVAEARSEVGDLLPVVVFLAALLVLARICDDEGLFRLFGSWMAQASPGRPRVLLGRVFILATLTTAVLSLDATVVLLTPVVIGATRLLGAPGRPHLYATAHLANSASLLLPVSNLTNLLMFNATGLSFARFSVLMAVPWLAAVLVEFVLFRLIFGADLTARPPVPQPAAGQPVPIFVLVVLGLTLSGFAVASLCGVSPAWAAFAGVAVLGGRSLIQGRSTAAGLLGALNVPFLIFVLALGVVVKAVLVNGMGAAMDRLLPTGTGLVSLLAIAAIAAVLANLLNNLPAALVVLPPLAACGPAALLAGLIGVNIGPNLSYVGSLSNLLWRRILNQHAEPTSAVEFSVVGAITVPVCLVAAVVGLWAGVELIGV